MAVADVASGRFEFGRVFTRAFEVIRGNLVSFSILGLIATLPTSAYQIALTAGYLPATFVGLQDTKKITLYFGALAVATIVGGFLGLILQATLTYGSISYLGNQPVTLSRALGIGVRQFLPLLAIGLLEGLAMGGALILLIFPAFMLYAMWAAVVPVRVAENTGIFESFGRSRALTAGYRWPIFGTLFVFLLGAGIAQNAARVLVTPAAISGSVVSLYVGVVLTALITAIVAVASATLHASMYYELRLIKEGVGPAQIASVFD
jgi:hypothetical protein